MRHLRGNPVATGGLVLVIGIVLVVMGFLQVVQRSLEPSTSTVEAHFATTGQLKENDPVRIDGVKVGKVQSIELEDGGRGARVGLGIEHKGLPLFRDARATIAERNLLGGSFLVNVDRGHARTGRLGTSGIPRSQTSGQTELEDLQTVTRGRAGRGLTTTFAELARALRDPVLPTQAVKSIDDNAEDIAKGVRALRGQDEERDLRILVRESARAAQALDAPTGEISRLVGGLGATLQTTSARGDDLRAIFAQAPGTLRRSTATLTRLDTTLGELDPLVTNLRRSAADVAPALRDLRPTLGEADDLLDDARPLVRALRPAARSLVTLSQNARPLLDKVDPSLTRLKDTILPYFNKLDPRVDHTPAEMVGPTFSVLGSAGVGQLDNNGHFVRFPGVVGESFANFLPCRTFIANPDAKQLAACDSLQALFKGLSNPDPTTAPGSARREVQP